MNEKDKISTVNMAEFYIEEGMYTLAELELIVKSAKELNAKASKALDRAMRPIPGRKS